VGYDRTGQKDSAAWCIHECEKLADQLEPYYQAYLFYGLGSAYAESDREKAEDYLKKSIELEPLPQAYTLLSDIYMAEGNPQLAKKLWSEVMQMPWDEFKVGVLDAKLEYEFQNHDFEEYRHTQQEKSEAMVRYYEKRLQNKADELSRKYDIDLYQHKVRSRTLLFALCGISAIVMFVFLHRIRVRRIENRRIKAELDYEKAKNTVALLDNRIAKLQKSKAAEVATLKEKNDKLKTKIQNNLQHGHDLYDKLNCCESPLNWTDDDLFCLFDFVATVNPQFILSLDTDYDGLNAQQKLFMVADNFLQKEDHELCNMFNLDKNSLRNKRNRIKKKRVNQQGE
jgi:tetratricopeptide (TPR) repeat protein